MKTKFLILLFLISTTLVYGQEIKLQSGTTTTAGIRSDLSSLNISKWRLGQVHSIILNSDKISGLTKSSWKVKSYPNPFERQLNLEFITDADKDFIIQIYDISGKKLWFSEEKKISPNQTLKLDLSFLSNALYLVSVTPKDNTVQKVIKVHKH